MSPLQRLIGQPQLTNEDKKKLEIIWSNASRMNYLIDELLTFSKIEMKQQRIHVRKGNIMDFLDSMSGIFRIVAKNKDIEFIVSLEKNTEEVWFCPSYLERIMYNLLSNAFKYSETRDYVRLSARLTETDEGRFAEISVKDSGIGIPEHLQKKIFDNYFQVSSADESKGTGLGLALTRSLINMHKGTIRVNSQPEKGSEFIVTLNVSEAAYTLEERSLGSITTDDISRYNRRMQENVELRTEGLSEAEARDDRECILVVEDNRDMNGYIADIFKDKYEVLKAYDGIEACKIMEKRLPDLIVSDIMMPVMNGIELLEEVKGNVSSSHIPVIMLTAKTEDADRTAGYLAGADAYISKPFNARNLELLVHNIQNSRKRNIERFKQAEELNIKQITNNPRDEHFMKELMRVIMENIKNEDFGVNIITSRLHISRSLLHNKIKALSGSSITQFIRAIRMREAKKHLLEGMNVSETSYAVGIFDPNYFTKCFKKEFDMTPSEFLKKNFKTVKESQ